MKIKRTRTTLAIAGIITFLSLTSLVDPDTIFWGWSYGTPSAVTPEGGTGNCFQEVTAQHYIFWIGGSLQTKYRYADCNTGAPLSGWMDSLTGIE